MKKVLVTKDGKGKFVTMPFDECLVERDESILNGELATFYYAPAKIQGTKPLAEDFEEENLLLWAVDPAELELQEEIIETKKEFEDRKKKEQKEMEERIKEAEKKQKEMDNK